MCHFEFFAKRPITTVHQIAPSYPSTLWFDVCKCATESDNGINKHELNKHRINYMADVCRSMIYSRLKAKNKRNVQQHTRVVILGGNNFGFFIF